MQECHVNDLNTLDPWDMAKHNAIWLMVHCKKIDARIPKDIWSMIAEYVACYFVHKGDIYNGRIAYWDDDIQSMAWQDSIDQTYPACTLCMRPCYLGICPAHSECMGICRYCRKRRCRTLKYGACPTCWSYINTMPITYDWRVTAHFVAMNKEEHAARIERHMNYWINHTGFDLFNQKLPPDVDVWLKEGAARMQRLVYEKYNNNDDNNNTIHKRQRTGT